MAKSFRGGKVNQSHSSAIDAAQKVIKAANRLPEVTKISLGVITWGLSSGAHRIKFTPIQGGLRVEVRGSRSKQQLFVYTKDPPKTESALAALFTEGA